MFLVYAPKKARVLATTFLFFLFYLFIYLFEVYFYKNIIHIFQIFADHDCETRFSNEYLRIRFHPAPNPPPS